LRNPAPPNFKAPFYELPRLAAGQPVHCGILAAACDFIDERQDCSDFIMHCLLRLVYQFAPLADQAGLRPGLVERIRRTILSFKYWPDEPGLDSLCTWTENHQVLYASAAYLAGQLFPHEFFGNSGHSGRELMGLHAPRLRRWLDLRFRTGFSEWLSNVYYDEDLTALVSLLDFCREAELRQRAAAVTNVLLLDLALHTFKGAFACTHGRSYESHKKDAGREALTDTIKLLFGAGLYARVDNMSAIALALSPAFTLPPALEAIANDCGRPEALVRQQMGIRLADAERWGLYFDNFEDGMVFLSLEAYLHPRNINLTFKMFDAFHWWDNNYFEPFKKNRKLVGLLRRLRLLPMLARVLENDLCRNTREAVNIYTYRTPDYQLSSAVDYRPGYGGDQQAIWQATLAPDAVCFVTHPGKRTGHSPDYWTGEGTLPRVAQFKNILISIYRIDTSPGLYHTNRLLFTHAYLPRSRFDEVVEAGGWILARKGDGYLALRARNGYLPGKQPLPGETTSKESETSEVISPGRENIWLCEVGRRQTHGPFDQFVTQIVEADVAFDHLNVKYNSPSQGEVRFGWCGPFTVNRAVVPLSNFPRYDSPYVQCAFDPEEIDIQAGGHRLRLARTGVLDLPT
jgi:hypothetical protein